MRNSITVFITILLLKITPSFAQTPKITIDDNRTSYYEELRFKEHELNKSFYYIRHGQTDTNKTGIASINRNLPLNEKGKLQAQKAAKMLQNKNIKIIVASSLLRAKQTAEIINKELNVKIIYDDGLKEADWGIVKGEDFDKISNNKKIWLEGGAVSRVESLYQFQTRVHNTIKEIINKYDNVLIVGHSTYFANLAILLNGEYLKAKNAIPIYFKPIPKNDGKKLYQSTPLI